MSSRSFIVLLSGGLDSAANLALALQQDSVLLALTCDYGQKAAQAEVASAQKLANYYGVPHQVVDLHWLGQLGGSALTEEAQPIPELVTSQLDDLEVIQNTAKAVWVPNRNGVFIQVAAAYAEKWRASHVVVGFNREEAVTFPDNSMEFMKKATDALRFSTQTSVEILSFTAELDKTQIVQELRKLKPSFPFELIWSCYLGGTRPCKHCESCKRFGRAMSQAS